MIRPDTDSAQVRVPPPLLLLLCVLGGVAFEKAIPFSLISTSSGEWVRWWAGSACLLVALALILSAVISFKKAHTALEPWKTTSALVTSGIFRFLRNPIYLGFIFIGVGVGFYLKSHWVLMAQIALFLLYRFYVIPKEETYLKNKFGNDYSNYCDRVGRWGI